MKVGSTVECIKNISGCCISTGIKVGKPIAKGDILTVRELAINKYNGNTVLLFEEIINGCNAGGLEWGYGMQHFRELLPPSPIEELIGDALTAPIPEQVKQLN